MKVYLDDERKCPKGWILTKTPEETIELLKTNEVEFLSLDHDLGEISDTKYENPITGYDVLLWIEEQVLDGFKPPKIIIHSANPVAVIKMKQAIKSIMKYSSMV